MAARENSYLPGYPFPTGCSGGDFDAALAHVAEPGSLLIAACPVAGLRPLLQR
jgi:glycerol-3-phosphate dehydrogenase (NAD(P)+)